MGYAPRDDGLLGPDAIAWRVIGHPGALIGGLRALIVQSLYPPAMAGVAEHSDYERRPLERLKRTTYYVAATAFGDTETAMAAVARVKRVHGRVRGIEPLSGKPYSAEDPEAQVWVHSTEWHSFLAAYRVFGPGLTPQEEDRYIAEGATIGSLLGTPRERFPASVAEMREFFDGILPELAVSDAARSAIRFVANPRPTRELLPYLLPLRLYGSAAVALVPRRLRRLAGIERPRSVDAAAVAACRPLVSALTVPGVHNVSRLVIGRDSHEVIAARRRATEGAVAGEVARAA